MDHKDTLSSQSSSPSNGYWRSLEQLMGTSEFQKKFQKEFPQGAEEFSFSSSVDRRNFLQLMGGSLALAGLTNQCIRKPKQNIYPYALRPEDVIPGKPLFFSTSLKIGPSVQGVVVTSYEGRPTKIEGNPRHPSSLGATNAWAQSRIIELYDPHRATESTTSDGQKLSLEQAKELISKIHNLMLSNQKVSLLIEDTPSPSLRYLIDSMQKKYPKLTVYIHDPKVSRTEENAYKAISSQKVLPYFHLDKVTTLVCLDSDLFGIQNNSVRYAKDWAKNKKDVAKRHYSIEPSFSLTGMSADHHLIAPVSEMGSFIVGLLKACYYQKLPLPPELSSIMGFSDEFQVKSKSFIDALAKDLISSQGRALVTLGSHYPEWMHLAVHSLNMSLKNVGSTLTYISDSQPKTSGYLKEYVEEIRQGNVAATVILGGDPFYTSDLILHDAMTKVPLSLHLSYYKNLTCKHTSAHLPQCHELEQWGDLQSLDGTVGIQQPLIEPLYPSLSVHDVLLLLDGEQLSSYEFIRNYWKTRSPKTSLNFEKSWQTWVHDGIIPFSLEKTLAPLWDKKIAAFFIDKAKADLTSVSDGYELLLRYDYSVYDGRFGNNPWLHELPDPVTKLTWDNALLIAPATLASLSLKSGQFVELKTDAGKTMEVPVFSSPGTDPKTFVLPLGYGQQDSGPIALDKGFNAYSLMDDVLSTPFHIKGVTITPLNKHYALATTQEYGMLEGRPAIRENTREENNKDPNWVDKSEIFDKEMHKNLLWKKPNATEGHQWGMVIDLNSCIGCHACTIACQSENNIPVVGKERILQNRDMQWIRIDRYFTGTIDNPQAVFQPVACQHCEMAPCESVCPVAATVHGEEGTNDIAYNRCIGTRFCANNCPYKVRRFNFFNYQKENEEENPLLAMQRNPNVTVRFRGVIEKCTYCIHRVNDARIETKKEGLTSIPDGRVVTACQQVCPTEAITFGNINDPQSKVSLLKKSPLNYAVLGELNVQPRTTYLGKIRNPNPELNL